MQFRRTFQTLPVTLLASVNALAAELPPALASGALRSEQFLPAPRIDPGSTPRACVLASRLRADPQAGITSRDQQALFWWGKLHFKFEGGCTDWDYVASKWQETIGNPVTGSLTAADVAALSKTNAAATASLGTAVDADTMARQREKARLAQEAAAAARAKARTAVATGAGPGSGRLLLQSQQAHQAMQDELRKNQDESFKDAQRRQADYDQRAREEAEAIQRRNEQMRQQQERWAEEERQRRQQQP